MFLAPDSASAYRRHPFRIVFSPQFMYDSTWRTGNSVRCKDLIKFIEACLSPNKPTRYRHYLIPASPLLINLLRDEAEALRHWDPASLLIREVGESRLEQWGFFPADHPYRVERERLKVLREQASHLDYNNWQDAFEAEAKLNSLPRPRLDFGIAVKRVPWKLLESKEGLWDQLVRHYTLLAEARKEDYDLERLRFTYSFAPNEVYVGADAFEGYVVFCFASKNLSVLECPKTGNALYLMRLTDWKSLSQLSKTELLETHRRDVYRIIHAEEWQHRLALCIKHGGFDGILELDL